MMEVKDEDLRKLIMEEIEFLLKKEKEDILKRAHRRLREQRKNESEEKLS